MIRSDLPMFETEEKFTWNRNCTATGNGCFIYGLTDAMRTDAFCTLLADN